jgi:hypothetical protein
MYTDLYLQFESEEQARGLLFDAVEVPATKEVEVTVYLVKDPETEETSTTMVQPAEDVEILDQWMQTITEVDQENMVVEYRAKYRNMDTIGMIYEPTGEMTEPDEDGISYPEMAPVEGWHVNLRLTPDESADGVEELLSSFKVEPKTPVRVWG